MKREDLKLTSASGICTGSLVTAILESRRAYLLAMSLARRVLLEGPQMVTEWDESVPLEADAKRCVPLETEATARVPLSRRPALMRPRGLAAARRRRSGRRALRLVPSLLAPQDYLTPSTRVEGDSDEQANH